MEKIKTITVSVPCNNEEENVEDLALSLLEVLDNELIDYNCHIQFIENHSTDNTWALLRQLCQKDTQISAIFNKHNFDSNASGYCGFINCNDDTVIPVACDFHTQIELIPKLVKEWENSYKIVYAKSSAGNENRTTRAMRSLFYKIIRCISKTPCIDYFKGLRLYDKSFIDIRRKMGNRILILREQVAKFGFDMKEFNFVRPKRKRGQNKNSLYYLFSLATNNFSTYWNALPELAIIASRL